jgi:DNA repair protein RadC
LALSNADLLAIVVGRGNFEENAIDISNRVLKSYDFDKLSDLSFHELKEEFRNQVPAMKIMAMYEIFRRTNKLKKMGNKRKIETAKDVFNYYVDKLQDKKKEHFYALYLDTKNQIIEEKLVSKGILNASLIHPREVFKILNASLIHPREVFNPAIRASSNSVILVHNHPSGNYAPSKEDKEVTKLLDNAGNLLGINVLDHIIIGKEGYYSFKENE